MEEENVQEESVKSKFLEMDMMKINKQKLHGFQKTLKQASRNTVGYTYVLNKLKQLGQRVCN
jgi:hypothetical protein